MKIEPAYNVEKYSGAYTTAHVIKETELISQYLDYFNNFLTIERFAEYYAYPIDTANFVINKGRELNNK
jgi:hypothetical protein